LSINSNTWRKKQYHNIENKISNLLFKEMKKMPSYRPGTVTITTTNNGSITAAATASLDAWNRTLALGLIEDSNGNPQTNVAVRVVRLASATGASTTLGVTFTDTLGEYGVSLPILTGTQVYRFDAYSPVS